MPVQLPVCWRSPVSRLKTVLFPTFGSPARAITRVSISSLPSFDHDAAAVPVAQGKDGAVQTVSGRIAQRAPAETTKLRALDEPQLPQTPPHGAGQAQKAHTALLAGAEGAQRQFLIHGFHLCPIVCRLAFLREFW